MTDLALAIEGMHCGGCVRNVTRTLERIDGVQVKRVDLGGALVAIDPARTTPDAVAAAVTDAGYPARAA
jgi:copper chaperone